MDWPRKQYHIIYADPPWSYRDKREAGRTACGAENHYPCMSLSDIRWLPVVRIAELNAVLFMWATFPLLREALDVIEHWGFRYKTLGFSWIKLNRSGTPWHGVGAYAKSNCEVCLMATRGDVGRLVDGEEPTAPSKLAVRSNAVSSVVLAERGPHSRKPPEVRDRIVRLFGDVSRIELFARERTPGWDAWGNELLGDDDRVDIGDPMPVPQR